ncbi:MAG: hypothetical protein K2X81_15730, partial [Candidatus Obscuribacterales bacterium]|nr:hypothetical protein [Candidatus Obscuribacterales bacterium]
RVDMHDICLLLFAACLGDNSLRLFDQLIAIKEHPGDLKQIDFSEIKLPVTPQFNSGLRMFAISKFEAAEKAFSLAIEKDPNNPSGYIAKSILYILDLKSELAYGFLEEAEQRNADPILLTCIKHIIAIALEGETADPWASDPVSMAAVSFFMLKKRQYLQVIEMAEKHLQENRNDALMRLFSIEAQLLPLREAQFDDPPVPGAQEPALFSELSSIHKKMLDTLARTETMELLGLNCIVATNLSLLTLMQRNFVAATKYAKAALAFNPSSAEAKINLATAMLATGDLPALMRALEGIGQKYMPRAARIAAESYYHACSFEQAIAAWKRVMLMEEDRLWRLRFYCRMLEVYRLLQDAKNAQECVDALLTQFQHEPETLFALGYELWQLNRVDDSIIALKRAKELAAPNLQKWIAWQLGRIYFVENKTLSATDEYVSISDKAVDSIQSREFAVALYKADMITAAYERAKALREANGDVISGITEIEADFLVREKKIEEAKELLVRLSDQRPKSFLTRMAVVRLCASLNQEEEALEHLGKVAALDLTPEMQSEVNQFNSDLNLVISMKKKAGY